MTANTQQLYEIFPRGEHERKAQEYFEQLGLQSNETRILPRTSASTTNVIVCFTNRCGSTLISSILSQVGVFTQPNKHLNFEYFNGPDVVRVSKELGFGHFLEYVEHAITTYKNESGVFATKLSVDQLAWFHRASVLPDYLKNPIFIYSTRKNIVAQAISFSIAEQTRNWISLHKLRDVEPQYDFSRIASLVRSITSHNASFELYFDLHNIDPLRVVYEEVSAHPNLILDKFLARYASLVPTAPIKDAVIRPERQATELNDEWEKRFRSEYRKIK